MTKMEKVCPNLPGTRLFAGSVLAHGKLPAARVHLFKGARAEDAIPVDLVALQVVASFVDRLALALPQAFRYALGPGYVFLRADEGGKYRAMFRADSHQMLRCVKERKDILFQDSATLAFFSISSRWSVKQIRARQRRSVATKYPSP